jgi:hypothetical protein
VSHNGYIMGNRDGLAWQFALAGGAKRSSDLMDEPVALDGSPVRGRLYRQSTIRRRSA